MDTVFEDVEALECTNASLFFRPQRAVCCFSSLYLKSDVAYSTTLCRSLRVYGGKYTIWWSEVRILPSCL